VQVTVGVAVVSFAMLIDPLETVHLYDAIVESITHESAADGVKDTDDPDNSNTATCGPRTGTGS
jgi:hypothetical protein